MNYKELGERVKQKYPEYKDIDSTLLGQKTASKYPEYKSMITETSLETTKPKTQEPMIHGVPKSVLDEARSGMNQTLLGIGNSATMQIPRTVANITAKMAYGPQTPEVIPPGNLGGQIAGALLPGGIAGRIGALATSGIKGTTLLPSMARMAGQGAIESQALDYKDLPSRAMGALGGGVLGGALPLAGAAFRGIKSVATSGGKLKAINKEIEALKSLPDKGDMKEASGIAFRALSKAEKSMKSELAASKKSGLLKLSDSFKESRKLIDTALTKESVNASTSAKGKIRQMLDSMSDTYRAGLDDAEAALASRGESLTKQDIYDTLIRSYEDSKGYGIAPEGVAKRVFDEANAMVNKIDGDIVSLDKAKSIKNYVFNSLSEGAKSSTKHFDEYDGAKNVFLKNYGELIGQRSPELKALNAEFGPMAQMRSWAIRNFKPFTNDEIPDAANLLKRIASSKSPNPKDVEYLSQLEKGIGRFSGTGDIRGGTTKLGTESKGLAEKFDLAKRNLVDSIDFRIHQLEESFKPDISTVKKAKADFNYDFQQRQGVLESLGQKREKLKELKTIRNWAIGLTGASLLGGTTTAAILKAKGLHNLDILN